ncbi:MAG: LuxR C-terminal-related transcriptional regulator [Eubacteriales bacterium]|nr:LuxR C-terminal-related transcriptional regulator [Eubacteriales bacterium]
MAHLKQVSNIIYISKDLKDKLSQLERYRYSFICAPSGYGKSAVLRSFFKNYPGHSVLWIDGNCSKELFWKNLCNAIKLIAPAYSSRFLELDFPESDSDVARLIEVVSCINVKSSPVFLIIENFSDIADKCILDFLLATYNSSAEYVLKVIFITKEIHNKPILQLIGKDNIGYVGKEDFKFQTEDIIDFFRLNELKISEKQAQEIYNYCLGWPFIVELAMQAYRYNSSFDNPVRLNNFLGTNIWMQIDDDIRKFLLSVCVFHEFSIYQSSEHTGLSADECIEIINKSGLFDYERTKRVFKLNPIIKGFVTELLEDRPVREKAEIYVSAADTYISRKKFFYGIKLYIAADRYDCIYQITPKLKNLYRYIIKENKNLFFNIANHYWDVEKSGHYDMPIIICFAMFLYNEKIMMKNILCDLKENILADKQLSAKDKSKYLAEVQYVSCFADFNDFGKMNKSLSKVSDITKLPVDIIAGHFPFSFGCPSYLSLYHKAEGALDTELVNIDECAPDYYRITNGHGKGFEAIMRAEVLFNRCELDGAEILCHKAAYMAESREQGSIYIIANYMLALISLYHGSNDEYKEYVNNFLNKYSAKLDYSDQLKQMAEICMAMLNIALEETDRLPEWLTDEKLMEDSSNFITLSYVNIIYGKYLILIGDYHHFLGISGQLLGLSKVYSYIIPRIYTYIYLAIANNAVGEGLKAQRFIIEAMQLSEPDKLYMPFVMNFELIEEILKEASVSKTFSAFVKTVCKYSKIYGRGMRVIQKAGRLLSNFGLTERETEVARLAAQRLTNKEIADTLFIAESTVKSNMKVIFNKLSITARGDLKNFFDV